MILILIMIMIIIIMFAAKPCKIGGLVERGGEGGSGEGREKSLLERTSQTNKAALLGKDTKDLCKNIVVQDI